MLLALYFFLAGMAVSQQRLLLLTPAASAVFRSLLWLATMLSHWFVPAYRSACPPQPLRTLFLSF